MAYFTRKQGQCQDFRRLQETRKGLNVQDFGNCVEQVIAERAATWFASVSRFRGLDRSSSRPGAQLLILNGKPSQSVGRYWLQADIQQLESLLL